MKRDAALLAGFAAVAAAGSAWAWLRWGPAAFGGFLLGVLGTAAAQAIGWIAVRLAGSARSPLAIGLGGLAYLLKLPLLVALWMLSRGLGSEGPNAFVAGLALVYCGTLAWAATKR
ncbi:MAG: hypothetical protein N2109_07630 [Fimbriimonadales bacterium]|nr:hypothetical protein [Fimbriimonadales bacterium]